VWRKFHLLTPSQVFIVASLSASVFAAVVAVQSVSADATNIMSDLLWPHQFDPYIGFAATFSRLSRYFSATTIWVE
jgi:hypothetical protein